MTKTKFPLRLNIQFFADDNPPADPPQDPPGDNPPADPPKGEEPKDPPAKTFTQAEVDKIAKDRVARAEKDKEKAIEEAQKLAKMNADEKQKYELEKLQDEIAELRKKDAFYGLSKEATKMLSGHSIIADDELLGFVVKDTAEDTQKAVNSFVALVEARVDAAVKEKLKGTPPKKASADSGALTRASINAIKDSSERIKARQENLHLFK